MSAHATNLQRPLGSRRPRVLKGASVSHALLCRDTTSHAQANDEYHKTKEELDEYVTTEKRLRLQAGTEEAFQELIRTSGFISKVKPSLMRAERTWAFRPESLGGSALSVYPHPESYISALVLRRFAGIWTTVVQTDTT